MIVALALPWYIDAHLVSVFERYPPTPAPEAPAPAPAISVESSSRVGAFAGWQAAAVTLVFSWVRPATSDVQLPPKFFVPDVNPSHLRSVALRPSLNAARVDTDPDESSDGGTAQDAVVDPTRRPHHRTYTVDYEVARVMARSWESLSCKRPHPYTSSTLELECPAGEGEAHWATGGGQCHELDLDCAQLESVYTDVIALAICASVFAVFAAAVAAVLATVPKPVDPAAAAATAAVALSLNNAAGGNGSGDSAADSAASLSPSAAAKAARAKRRLAVLLLSL